MRRIKRPKVKSKPIAEVAEPEIVDDENTSVDMTGWEELLPDDGSLEDIFFVVKGQCGAKEPTVTVKNGNTYYEINVGSYNPDDEETVNHYCIYDRITFHCIYGGSSLEKGMETLTKRIVNCKNSCEVYFREVCELTNEDYYHRHYENGIAYSPDQMKRIAEDGKSWRVSDKMKAHEYAIMTKYAMYFQEDVENAVEKAKEILRERAEKRKVIRRKARKKRIRVKRKL